MRATLFEKVALQFTGIALSVGALVYGLSGSEDHAFSWQLAARYTARIAFGFFLIVYLSGPVARFAKTEWSSWLLTRRRYTGLAFGWAHLVHLFALTTFVLLPQGHASVVTLVFGGLGYLILIAMMTTSNNTALHLLGSQNWKRLHRFGIHYLWVIFALTYAGRIADHGQFWIGIIFTTLVFAALLVRLLLPKLTRR